MPWLLAGFVAAVALLCSCTAPARLPLPAAVREEPDGTSRDSAFWQLLPLLIENVRDPGNREWPPLVDVETFAIAGESFVGHPLSRAEVAATLKHRTSSSSPEGVGSE